MIKKIALIILFFSSLDFAQNVKLIELENIYFEGNDYFSNAELQAVIGINETPNAVSQTLNSIFGIGEEAVYFDSLMLNEEEVRLKSFYFNNGFFNARITSESVINEDDNYADVKFIIYEGEASNYNKIMVYGLDSLKGDDKWTVQNYIKTDTTEQYSYEKLSSINENIVSYLNDNGYMLCNIDSTLIYIDTLKNKVNTKLFFNLGKKYSISDINVEKEGNGKDEVDDNLILDLVGINKDDIYSKYSVQRGQGRLYKTKIFNVSTIKSEIADTVGDTVPLKISTEIGNLYQATPEVIMNNEDDRFNLGLGLGFSKRNFFGGARTLTLNTSIAAQNIFEFIQNMSVSNTNVIGYADLRLILDQPFLFGQSIDTRYELYTTLQKRRDEYNTTVNGFKVGLNFELPKYVYLTSFGSAWNIEKLQVLYQQNYLKTIFQRVLSNNTDLTESEIDSASTVLANGISKSTNSTNTILSLNFGANKTDNFTFPTKGIKTHILLANGNFINYLSNALFNSELDRPLYYKVQVDFSIFPHIYYSPEDAFGIKFRVGNIQVYNGMETEVPYNQRFTSGGSNSIRGWQSRDLVPDFDFDQIDFESLSPSELEAIFLDQATPGGLFQLEGTIETRNRLIGKIGGALFVDYGNTWANAKAFRYDQIAVSIGFGFRYYTDFIPFRIDFAMKVVDPKSNVKIMKRPFWSDLLQIHFAIGEAF